MTKREVGYITAKLEELHEDIREMKRSRFHLDERVRSLEKSRSFWRGALALISVLYAAALKYIHMKLGG